MKYAMNYANKNRKFKDRLQQVLFQKDIIPKWSRQNNIVYPQVETMKLPSHNRVN